jgi:hypothetical protein
LAVLTAGIKFRTMFQDWKEAWREAVENFRREVGHDALPDGASPRARIMHRELSAAREAFSRLEAEILRSQRDASAERESEAVCRRREGQARTIGDDETVRIAIEYAVRHSERAAIFERKVEVLIAERDLLRRDLEAMEKIVSDRMAAAPTPEQLAERDNQERDFGRLEREAREKAAADRLEELKRKMR